jgi:hypothetical protein
MSVSSGVLGYQHGAYRYGCSWKRCRLVLVNIFLNVGSHVFLEKRPKDLSYPETASASNT